MQQSALEERHLHIAGEDVVTQEPTFALDAIERRIPPRTLVRFRQRTHDEVIESAPDSLFQPGMAVMWACTRTSPSAFATGVAARKENRLRAGPLGAGLRWLTGYLVCHCVHSKTRFLRLNLLKKNLKSRCDGLKRAEPRDFAR